MTSKTQWLRDCRHPSSEEIFSLPDAIYFLIKFRADLAHFKYRSIKDRMVLYFWWQALGKANYPDFDWILRPVDIEYVMALDTNTLLTEYPECVAYWLRNASADALNEEPLIDALLEPQRCDANPDLELPRFLRLIIGSRPDLARHLDTTTFTGQLACLDWWNKHGQAEFPKLAWSTHEIYAALNRTDEKAPRGAFSSPRFLAHIIGNRPDLKDGLDLTTPSGQIAAANWWERDGRQEYPGLVWSTTQFWARLNERESDAGDGKMALPRFLSILIGDRPDLAGSINLGTAAGQFSAVNWWERSGRAEYPMLRWATSEYLEGLNQLDEPVGGSCLRIPRFVSNLIASRPDLPAHLHPAHFSGQIHCLQWWQDNGKDEQPHLIWSISDALEQLSTAKAPPSGKLLELPQFLLQLREGRPDLQGAFDVSCDEGRRHLVQWWEQNGRNEYRVLDPLTVQLPGTEDSRSEGKCSVSITLLDRTRPAGVNIVGFPQGVLGLGEDARTAWRALQTASIPAVLVNAPMIGPKKLEHSCDHLLSDELKHDISLFCLPPPEMVRLALEGGKKIIESNTYKIGAWPWELPQWPNAFGKVHQFVDEIWAQSAYVQSAFARQGETPVHRMPMAVQIPSPVAAIRARFGLPEGRFFFYLMFDGNSWLSRKNPVAGVRAFQQAFAGGETGVGLVIKAMNIRDNDPIWKEVVEIAARDARIHLLSERMSRQDTIDFMASCDAYISLHRSEGFGRVIAEAMALGQPVVVTNFSGNVDFCNAQTSYLVDGELVPLRPGDYLFHEGQYWCDPDVSIAARQLVRVIEDAKERERIAAAGKLHIATDYSIEAVGRAYAARLLAIRAEDANR
jgi:glycosyltransferase involved in cell wall biosynthesis